MTIISILNPKGGSGKTTLATNLARSLQEYGTVLIVDSDPQGSARDWHAANEKNPLPIVALDRPENLRTLNTIAAPYEFVIIDGAAKLEKMMAATIKQSDIVLIPLQPSPYDLWAVADLVEFIKARQEITDGKPQAAFVITRAIQGTKLDKEIKIAVAEYEIGILETQIMQRQVYPQTAAEGQTVFDSNNSDAKKEISALTAEIVKFIK